MGCDKGGLASQLFYYIEYSIQYYSGFYESECAPSCRHQDTHSASQCRPAQHELETTMTTLALSRFTETAAASPIISRTFPAVGRVFLATIFLLSGFGKLTAAGPTITYIASSGLPFPEVAYLAAVIVEIGGGLLLIAGYQTRLVAFLLAGFSIVAALLFHADFGDQNQQIHFLKNIAIAGGLMQVVVFGAGALSLDAKRINT